MKTTLTSILLCLLTSGLTAQRLPETQGNQWFEELRKDAGTHMQGEVAKGVFSFQNPHKEEHMINRISPSCTCSKVFVTVGGRRFRVADEPVKHAIYEVEVVDGIERTTRVTEIPVAGGAAGEIELHIDLNGVHGRKEASVAIGITDAELPLSQLALRTQAISFFTVSPREVNLNEMSWQEQREFQIEIRSSLKKDFEITGHDPLPEKMQIEYSKEMRGDSAIWRVKGTYGPGIDPRAAGGKLFFHTDVQDKKAEVTVVAMVTGPLRVSNTYIPLGLVRRGKGTTKTVEIAPTTEFDLAVEKIEVTKLSIPEEFVSVTHRKDGGVVKIDVTVAPEAPRRLVRGDILVTLNHPAAPKQELQFSGFVR